MGLRALIKKYPLFLVIALCAFASCRSFHLKSAGPVSGDDAEQQQLAREFKKLEKQAARQAKKDSWRSEKRKSKIARNRSNPKIEKVISTARSYRGTPYKFGGTTRIGIDCSGLLLQSFSAIDYKMPRNSTDQSYTGPSVREKDLRKGDLVFFSASRGSSQITHVGLVTEVKKPQEEVIFIHSSTRLGVIEDNLYGGYWRNLYIKAVRPSL